MLPSATDDVNVLNRFFVRDVEDDAVVSFVSSVHSTIFQDANVSALLDIATNLVVSGID